VAIGHIARMWQVVPVLTQFRHVAAGPVAVNWWVQGFTRERGMPAFDLHPAIYALPAPFDLLHDAPNRLKAMPGETAGGRPTPRELRLLLMPA